MLPFLRILVLYSTSLGMVYDHITSLHQTKLRKWCNVSLYIYVLSLSSGVFSFIFSDFSFFPPYVSHQSYFSYFGNKFTWELDVMLKVRVLFFVVIYSSMLQMLTLLDVLNFMTHLIAVWICSLRWSSSGIRLWTTHATFSGVPDWICFWYVCHMLISMIIHDHVMRLLEIEKEFIPVGAYILQWTKLQSISMLCSFLDWFWNFNHF